jgi:hypothetical protein
MVHVFHAHRAHLMTVVATVFVHLVVIVTDVLGVLDH